MGERDKLYNAFLQRFPIEYLPNMTLEEYKKLGEKDTFCYWLESKLDKLGSIWGGAAYKFGIYEYKDNPKNDSQYTHDEQYAWERKSGKKASDVFNKVKEEIIQIALAAQKGDWKAIEALEQSKTRALGPAIIWKIAFLYSNKQLLPIYNMDPVKKEGWLPSLAQYFGMPNADKASRMEIQHFLLEKKGDKKLFQFYDELCEIYRVHFAKKRKKKNKKKNTALVTEDKDTEEHVTVPSPQIVSPQPTSEESLEAYSDKQFLQEVYMSDHELQRLKALLKEKKNIILQGAPGVGKTFTAKRLAYLLMGVKDKQRIEMVQFHQNYSYEDFILGYKPNVQGSFELRQGLFYKFCMKAHNSPDKDFFFIIDEINRGNLSKIFGELLMLIENSYRGKEIKLAYTDEPFAVPNNLYIIGMMNTADRSLAMIDYALRRRFSFFEMRPGFETDGFKHYQEGLNSPLLDAIIQGIIALNGEISADDSLGRGFCIGHSYFCNQKVFSDEWLKNVIEYDIEPMLREYWFDDTSQCEMHIDHLKKLLK